MQKELYLVDSFTTEPFKGNPAGVCILPEPLSAELMLSIAQELGLSETAFVQATDSSDSYTIRFFSPKMEIPLCGHATLAASKVLFRKRPEVKTLYFNTIEQIELIVAQSPEGIRMEFPRYETYPAEATPLLLSALGITEVNTIAYNQETKILLIEIPYATTLRALQPDYQALVQSHDGINGVLVTAISTDQRYDFESRYFWPWSGTDEDPATGGTHTFLAPYWGKRLEKRRMNSFQCSKRTGKMIVELLSTDKIAIISDARIIVSGTLAI